MGGCAEYYTVKEKYCYRLRSNISWRDAALLEPLGVAHNACERLEVFMYIHYIFYIANMRICELYIFLITFCVYR